MPSTIEFIHRHVAPSRVFPGPNGRADVATGEAFDDLMRSIENQGILVSLIVRQLKGSADYEVVAGHRRLAAAQSLKLKLIPVKVAELDDAQAATIAAIENLQREDLSPLEEAEAYRQLRDGAGLNPKDIAARTGLPIARVNGVLRILELPEALAGEVDGSFPLSELKWVLRVPEAAANGREDVFRGITNGHAGKGTFFRVAEILDPEGRINLASKPSCLDCPKQRRYQVPPESMSRWNWRGETGKDWPEMPVCFDRVCRLKKEAKNSASKGRAAARRSLPAMVKKAVAALAETHDIVVNGYQDLTGFRRGRHSWESGIPNWPAHKGSKVLPKGYAWPLNGLWHRPAKDGHHALLRKKCLDCPHARIVVNGHVDHADRALVVVNAGCVRPLQREKELKEIRKDLDEAKEAQAKEDAKRLWSKDLPRLKKYAGAVTISDGLLRRFDKYGSHHLGPVGELLLDGDAGEGSSTNVKDLPALRARLKERAEGLYRTDPRKLCLLLITPYLREDVYSRDTAIDVIHERVELVGMDADPRRLELIEKGTLATGKDAIGAATADECRILVGRLKGKRGQKSKVAAIERRLGKLNKGDDDDAS